MASPIMDAIPLDFIRGQSHTLRARDKYTQDIVAELLDEFELKFPEMYAFAMGGAKVLGHINMDMSDLAADINFDIYVAYRNFYKDRLNADRDGLISSIAQDLATSLQRLVDSLQQEPAPNKLSGDAPAFPTGNGLQPHLMSYVISEVDRYISFKHERRCAEHETKAHLMAMVYLFDQLIADTTPT